MIFVFGCFFGGIIFGEVGEQLRGVLVGEVGVCGGEGGMNLFVGVVGVDQMMMEVFWFCDLNGFEIFLSFGIG